MLATAKSWPGPRASVRILSIAEVESAKTVYQWPLSSLYSLAVWRASAFSSTTTLPGMARRVLHPCPMHVAFVTGTGGGNKRQSMHSDGDRSMAA